MRKVLIKSSEIGLFEHPGYFHQWGLSFLFDKSITVGIIENKKGEVFTAEPWQIKFIDQPNTPDITTKEQ